MTKLENINVLMKAYVEVYNDLAPQIEENELKGIVDEEMKILFNSVVSFIMNNKIYYKDIGGLNYRDFAKVYSEDIILYEPTNMRR